MPKKQMLQNIVGTSVFLGSQWFMLIIIVNMMDYQVAGMFSLAISLTAVFYVISAFGLRAFHVSDVTHEYADRQYIFSRWIAIASGFAVCIIYICFSGYSEAQRNIIILYMVCKSLESLSDLLNAFYQNDNRFDYLCISMSTKGVLQLGVFWAGIALFSDVRHAIILMIAAVLIIILAYDIPRVRKHIRLKISRTDIQPVLALLKKCFPIVVVSSTTPLLSAIPRIYFESRYSSELFGIFSSVAAPTVIVTVIISSALTPLLPKFAAHYHQNDRNKLLRLLFSTIGITLGLGAAALIVCTFFGEFALAFIYGQDIRPYAGILNSIVITTILASILLCFNSMFIAARRQVMLAVVLLSQCVLCYFIVPYFVGRYEMYGIAYATIATNVFAIIALFTMFIRILYKMNIPESDALR